MWLWDIEDEESLKLIKWAREKHLRCKLEEEGAKQAYYEIIDSFVSNKLINKRIVPGVLVVIDFADEPCKCKYEGVRFGKIRYRGYTQKGAFYKQPDCTSWEMWEHIKRFEA